MPRSQSAIGDTIEDYYLMSRNLSKIIRAAERLQEAIDDARDSARNVDELLVDDEYKTLYNELATTFIKDATALNKQLDEVRSDAEDLKISVEWEIDPD